MKKIISFLGLTLTIITGCTTYLHVVETNTVNTTSSKNTTAKNDGWVYENDSLKITYNFWSPFGIMKFKILNKSDKPIYFDWKKSSYISKNVKFDYWTDKEISKTDAYTLGYVYSSSKFASPYVFAAKGTVTSGTTVIERPERITFIPPNSTFTKSLFIIQPKEFKDISKKGERQDVPRNDKPSKSTVVYTVKYSNEAESPIVFRNFLTYSFTENFTTENYIDNGFYVSSVSQMQDKHFRGKIKEVDEYGDAIYELPYYKPSSYYYTIESFSTAKVAVVGKDPKP